MEIKFKKLFKTMIIFFVVFVMIFNSFAAISVSDGSAFVTKAEFSADLNNLSNRMSALENSIDAKIDSLVSSYLSRNGIWNGERQDVNYTPDKLSVKTSSTQSESYVLGVAYGSDAFNAIKTNTATLVFSGNSSPSKIDFVSQVTKSGLCVLQYDLTSSSSQRIRVTLGKTDAYASYLMNAWLVYTRGIEIYEKIGSNVNLKVSSLVTNPVSVPGTFIVPTEKNKYMYFFVSKGSTLQCANFFYANTMNQVKVWDFTTNITIAESYPSFINCTIY